ncbi:MAG: adenylyltransferase/cytidyltransferase family protein [Zoogloeaceae bacterium]|jgi:rfaE bifunctional protein nucleotidyltransferase chain/domain|nr:adenylyltransferase/cytidyltransferase family protein [Zoogloeaceae bacterium]
MTPLPPPDFERKICLPEDFRARVRQLPAPRVLTNGCFDILHRGHVTYLAQARALGASLIVLVNTDASVKRQGKGTDRPINPLSERLAMLAALESVDLVSSFDEDTPEATILACPPEILVKGGDWPIEAIVGAETVLARGGQVHSIPFIHPLSTTAFLEKVRQSVSNPSANGE